MIASMPEQWVLELARKLPEDGWQFLSISSRMGRSRLRGESPRVWKRLTSTALACVKQLIKLLFGNLIFNRLKLMRLQIALSSQQLTIRMVRLLAFATPLSSSQCRLGAIRYASARFFIGEESV